MVRIFAAWGVAVAAALPFPSRAERIFGDGFETSKRACPAPEHFAAGLAPQRRVHVSTAGSDAAGDGSPARPYATLGRAALDATPGTAIVIHAGQYSGGVFLSALRGTATAPIWIGGAPGEAAPLFHGGSNAIQLSRPAYLVLHDLAVRGASANGVNIDDGGDYSNPLAAHHVAILRLDSRQIGSGGNQDCLKISGLRDFWVLQSHFERCGAGGSGIDLVGAHRGVIHGSRFVEVGASGVQAKGGSSDIDIVNNRFENGGARALNMGGSTGFEFFRPPLSVSTPNAEARRIRALANLFVGSAQTPLAFVGCVDCVAAHNTIVDPGRWLVRILQETVSSGGYVFEPARNGLLQNNLFVFRRAQVAATPINVGPNTEPGSFVWRHNLFYAWDQPAQSNPSPPGTVEGSLIGLDPRLEGPDHRPAPGSPAIAAGAPYDPSLADLGGRCFAIPPSIGAWEAE
ncbi:MAG: right-handed parallel beta-helix repeat-containing protein [Xanthomonadales bacterium]|nr:right-handed parallel beta-helix repeat-containing protein [Xanthomonadales bacterium]